MINKVDALTPLCRTRVKRICNQLPLMRKLRRV